MYAPFAKAYEYSKNISDKKINGAPTEHLFFTYEDYFVYFKELHPLRQVAKDIRIFKVENQDLKQVILADEAVFKDDYWIVKDAKTLIKPQNISLDSEGIIVTEKEDMKLLKGFRPAILDQVYEGSSTYSILDAFEAMEILDGQNVNTDKVKSVLYKTIVYPYFVPFLVIIIFFFVPVSPRFFNVSLFSFGALLVTLLIWGMFYTMIQLANAKTISGEMGIVLPVIILGITSGIVWYKKSGT
jgi:lipopolysaccharide export system permease protein